LFKTTVLSNTQNNNLLKSFIGKFTSDQFFTELIKMTLYPADFGSIQNQKTVDYIQTFLIDVEKIIRINKFQFQNTSKNIQLAKSLLNIRESRSNILNSDNVFQHINNQDLSLTKMIQGAIDNKIDDVQTFRKLKNNMINHVQSYYEINSISGNMNLYNNLVNSVWNESLPVFDAVKQYKETIISLYNDLSKLQTTDKTDKESDYFILTDKKSAETLSENLYQYVSSGYSFFKSGYKIFDDAAGGIESSSVHLIGAASNNGKSIFLSNLTRSMIEENIDSFEENDCILFLTLEDDINKLFRRFASLFGNYRHSSLRNLFKKCFELTKTVNETSNGTFESKIKKMFSNIVHTSILKTTGEKVSVVLKHCNEQQFTPTDLSRFMDQLNVDGYNVKLAFLDYVDIMKPSTYNSGFYDEYTGQGEIVQELRAISRIYKIPIISATQNKRESENLNSELNSGQIGDSYKKIRYADFVSMARIRHDLDLFSSPVKEHICTEDQIKNGIDPQILAIKDELSKKLIPFEMKTTKAKESAKNRTYFMLFCVDNLRIYNDFAEYLKDAPSIEFNTKQLNNDINLLTSMAYNPFEDDEIPF